MTTTNPAVAGATAAVRTSAPTPTPSPLANADFNMFLKLLTTQMQNQDPLDPMDTSEYTQQLVQYSQVEQSITQTGVLKDILARLSVQDMAQASAFIGKEVEIDTAVSGLSASQPARWNWTAPRAVSNVTVEILDSRGKTVATPAFNLAGGVAGEVKWDGKMVNGNTAPAGSYTLKLTGTDTAGATVPLAIRSVGRVDEVGLSGGKLSLGIGGVQLPGDKIVRVVNAPQG